MLNSRRKYAPGDILGIHELIECLEDQGPQWLRKWRWVCTKCRVEQVGVLQNIRRAISCPSCQARSVSETPKKGFKKGDRVGVWEIIESVESGDNSGRRYLARCTRCGETATQKLSNFREGSKYCQLCRNKVELLGRLLTYDEISKLFGIKKSLLLDRLGRRKMSLEEAVFKPVQQQDPASPLQTCTVCKIPQPRDQFSQKMGRCKTCRKKERRRRKNQALDPHRGLPCQHETREE